MPACAQRLKLIGTTVMWYTHYTWPLSSSCPTHFILIVRLPLTLMLLTSCPISLILTLMVVRPEFFLCLLGEAYRDCFHVFLPLCIFLRLHTWRSRHSQLLSATWTQFWLHLTFRKNSVPNAGLNLLRPDSGCLLRAGTGHGRPGRAPRRCGCAVTSLLQRGCVGAVC
jgi:hypothetical protein